MTEVQEERKNEEERIEELARPIRRAGLLFFLFIGLLLVIPMAIAAVQGIQTGQIWDPLTGAQVTMGEPRIDCVEESGTLIYIAGEVGRRDLRWEQRYRRWVSKCRQDHPELFVILNQSRERMMGSERLVEELGDDEEVH